MEENTKILQQQKNQHRKAFDVPEAYFETLPSLIEERVFKERTIFSNHWQSISGIAAAILIGFTLFFAILQKKDTSLEKFSQTEIYDYLLHEENILYSSETLLYAEYEKNPIFFTEEKSDISNEEQEIIEYLINEDNLTLY